MPTVGTQRTATVVVLAFVLGGCSTGDVSGALPTGPNESIRAAIFLSAVGEDDGTGTSAVAVTAADGTTEIVEVDPTQNGQLAFNERGALLIPTGEHTYLLDDGRPIVEEHETRLGSSWASSVDQGTENVSANIVPDSFGHDVEHLYIKGPDDYHESGRQILAVPLDHGSKERTYEWKHWGHQDGWAAVFTSGLFREDDKLYFLEGLVQMDDDETPLKFDGVHRSQIRIGSLDLTTGNYDSRFVTAIKEADRIATTDDQWVPVARAAVAAFNDDGNLQWISSSGQVMSASARTAEAEELCQLDEKTIRATSAVASWTAGKLHLLLSDGTSTWLQEIDLSTCTSDSTQLPEIQEYVENHDVDPTSLAILARGEYR